MTRSAKILLLVLAVLAIAVVGAVMWRNMAWSDWAVMWRDMARVVYVAVMPAGLGAA